MFRVCFGGGWFYSWEQVNGILDGGFLVTFIGIDVSSYSGNTRRSRRGGVVV